MKTIGRMYIDEILGEIDACDPELFPPPREVSPGDKQIGVMGEYGRKAFSLMTHYKREVKMAEVEIAFQRESPEMARHHSILSFKYAILKEIFWGSIRAEFDTWGANVGIRQGWIFVLSAPERPQTIGDFFKMLGGPQE